MTLGATPSADSCRFSHTLQYGLPVPLAYREGLPGGSAAFSSFCPPHLLSAAFERCKFALSRKLIQLSLSSPEVRGPQAGGLSHVFLWHPASRRMPLP